jgi:hypothetical protein
MASVWTGPTLWLPAIRKRICASETGCQPPEQKPGIWGAGGDQGLWQFPDGRIDFDSISLALSDLDDAADADGLHLLTSGQSGYHIIFTGDGNFTVRRVNSTSNIRGYSSPGEGLGAEGQGGCRNLSQVITGETTLGTYSVADNPIIFAEDNLWVEGTVQGRITIVAATFPIQSSNVDIWIPNSINADHDG